MDRPSTLRLLVAEVGRGELTFPTSADVVLRVRESLADPDCRIETAVRLIQADPLLATRVVAVANSVAFNRSNRTITDVRSAVNVLGYRMVRSLATAMIARRLAGTPDGAANRNIATQLWEHSAHVAALAQLLARQVTRQDPEAAMFAGMVHEIGGFYLLSRAREFPAVLEGDPADWMGEDDGEGATGISPENEIGHAVLKALSVPEPVVAAIEVLWDGYLAYPPTSLGDTLLLADELVSVKSPFSQPPGKHPSEAAAKIDLLVEQDSLSHILDESAAEVKSLTEALRL